MTGQPTKALPSARRGPTAAKDIYFVHKNSVRNRPAALIDRGANGGIAGCDMRIVYWTDRYIDLHGIDNHAVSALRVGTFGGVIRTNLGERILIAPQLAHMPSGKTILSAGQMEHFKTTVHEKSPTIGTGEAPTITTLEGHIIPITIRHGLPYIKL